MAGKAPANPRSSRALSRAPVDALRMIPRLVLPLVLKWRSLFLKSILESFSCLGVEFEAWRLGLLPRERQETGWENTLPKSAAQHFLATVLGEHPRENLEVASVRFQVSDFADVGPGLGRDHHSKAVRPK